MGQEWGKWGTDGWGVRIRPRKGGIYGGIYRRRLSGSE